MLHVRAKNQLQIKKNVICKDQKIKIKTFFSIQITLSRCQGYILLVSEAYLEPIRISTMEFFWEKPLTIFTKRLHRRCSAGF